jgi:hypothetical protein
VLPLPRLASLSSCGELIIVDTRVRESAEAGDLYEFKHEIYKAEGEAVGEPSAVVGGGA